MISKPYHIPVMAKEVVKLLRGKERGIFVDATIGAGGHTSIFLEELSPQMVIGIDRDPKSIQLCRERFKNETRVKLFHANYSDMETIIKEIGLENVDAILIDAGISSFALEDSSRGLSFQIDGPLDMRMNPNDDEPLSYLLAKIEIQSLSKILKEYGDVPKHLRVAKVIIDEHKKGRLKKVSDLVNVILKIFPAKNKLPDEVRQIFQALRIAVNKELFHLNKGLWAGLKILSEGGIFVVISFHSGEDRIVKSVFRLITHPLKEYSSNGFLKREIPPIAQNLTPKPLIPSKEEIQNNPRSKSAKMRSIQKMSNNYFEIFYSRGMMN